MMFKKTKKDENKTNDIPSSSTIGTSSNPLTIKVPNNQYIRSRNDFLDDFNHNLKPIAQIDSYFAVETPFCEKMRNFYKQRCTTSNHEDAKSFVDNPLNRRQYIQSSVSKIWNSGPHKNPTLKNTLSLDSGGQTVPSTDSRNNVEDSPKSVSSVSMQNN